MYSRLNGQCVCVCVCARMRVCVHACVSHKPVSRAGLEMCPLDVGLSSAVSAWRGLGKALSGSEGEATHLQEAATRRKLLKSVTTNRTHIYVCTYTHMHTLPVIPLVYEGLL